MELLWDFKTSWNILQFLCKINLVAEQTDFTTIFIYDVYTLSNWAGLAYLHTFPGRPVIHRDIKSSNILLDHSMCAKVADFGFSKYAPQEGDSNVSLEVRGTAGYLDPE